MRVRCVGWAGEVGWAGLGDLGWLGLLGWPVSLIWLLLMVVSRGPPRKGLCKPALLCEKLLFVARAP